MPKDPYEIKIESIDRQQKMQEIQNYMEEQDALDKQNKSGKIGPHEIKMGAPSAALPEGKIGGVAQKMFKFLKE